MKQKNNTEVVVGINQEETEKVENWIAFIKQSISAMGNNDSEFEQLDTIFREYMDGKITVDDAIAKANAVQEGKIVR